MMKLNKDSVSNNTSEQPDFGVLPDGTDLYTLPAGRYHIPNLATMVNRPPLQEFDGDAILLVDVYDEKGADEKGLQLWNDLGKYATARTQGGIQVSAWAVFTTDGGGTPINPQEGLSFVASSFSTIPIDGTAASPGFITGMSLAKGGENFAIDPATGAVQNRSGKNIKNVTGTINFQPNKVGGFVTNLFLYSERSTDGINFTPTNGTLRSMEISTIGEAFKTSASAVLDWNDNEWVRFRIFASDTGLNFESPSQVIEGGTVISGVSVFWELNESVGGSGGSDPQIGEMIQWAGDESTIPYPGTWIDHAATTVVQGTQYPEFVALNPDSVQGANELNLVSYTTGRFNFFKIPENYKYRDTDGYHLNLNGTSDVTGVIIRSSSVDTSATRIFSGTYNPSGNPTFYVTPGIESDDGNGTITIANGDNIQSPMAINNITMFDGTVVNGFMCFSYSKQNSLPQWCVHVKRTDLYQPDFGDWVNDTNDQRTSNQANNVSDNQLSGRIIHQPIFREDGFYLLFENSNPRKYSYDFSGGTLKEIQEVTSYDLAINSNYDKARSTQFGNLTEDCYQINSANGDLLINGSVVNTLIFTDPITSARLNVGYVSFWVHEYQDKIFVQATYQNNGSGNRSIQGWAYFDGTQWNNFIMPIPSMFSSSKDRAMSIAKLDLETGLMVGTLFGDYLKQDITEPTNTGVNFVVSLDFGQTWFDDIGITNSSTTDIANNTMPIGSIEVPNTLNNGTSTFTFNNLFLDNALISKTSMVEPMSPNFALATENGSYMLEWIYDVPLDTSTLNGYISLSNKLKNFVRIG